MDSVCEIVFLRAIEGRKGVLVSKQMSKECREEKKKAWDEIKHYVLEQTGREFNESQMVKKWQRREHSSLHFFCISVRKIM